MKLTANIFKVAEEIARKLSPDDLAKLKKLYREERANDKTFDDRVDELTKEIKDGLKHD